MDRISKQSGPSMTNHQTLLNQTSSSAVAANREDRLQLRHLPRARGGAQYSPPALTIMNPEDVCYDYQRAAAWHETHPYGSPNPYHQMPQAYRVATQQAHQQQGSVSREFIDLSQMVKYESPELVRGSSSYLRDPGQVASDQWTHTDDMVDPPSGYTLPSDATSLWQSYYPPTYAGVARQLGPSAAVQLTPSTGYQTFYNHDHLTSSMSDSDLLFRHSLSGHLHDAGSRRSSTEESRPSTIHSSAYQLAAAHSTPFPVHRPSQADFSGLQRSPLDPPNRLQVLSDTPGNTGDTHMRSYRHGMQTQVDAIIHHPASSTAPRVTSSDRVHSTLHHNLLDDSSASTSSSQRHTFTNDAKPKVTPSTSIGKTRTREKYRTVYTEQQKVELEQEYVKGTFISAQRKTDIAKDVGLTERQVKIWFQNRRAKDRKSRRKTEDNCVSTSHGLTSAINQVHSSVHSSDAESLSDTMSANAYGGGQRIFDFHQRIQQH